MLAALERSRDAERRFLADASHELRNAADRAPRQRRLSRPPRGRGRRLRRSRGRHRPARPAGRLAAGGGPGGRRRGACRAGRPGRAGRAAGRRAGIELEVEPGLQVLGDGPAIERALDNLVANARLYGPPGETINVRLARRAGAGRDRGHRSRRRHPTGAGRAGHHALLARPQQRGREGSGLGLALVRPATAERHGGALRIAGSTVAIELPLLRDSSRSSTYTAGDTTEEGP